MPCVCQELPFSALSGVSPPARPAGACRVRAPGPASKTHGFLPSGSWPRDVLGVILDAAELCINAETALEKSIWPPARKYSQPLGSWECQSPAHKPPPLPQQSIPGVLGVTGAATAELLAPEGGCWGSSAPSSLAAHHQPGRLVLPGK